LGHGRTKDIQATEILRLSPKLRKLLEEPLRILARELRHGFNAHEPKVAQKGWAYRDQIFELPFL
jgi:hypothetical protein